MNNNLFYEGDKLPEPLTKNETYDLFLKIKKGDSKARDIIIIHNIRLVIYEVVKKFSSNLYDKQDLVSIGIIGLVKAIDSFNITKQNEFSSYAIKCIDNEILMYLRKRRITPNIISLNDIVYIDDKNNIKIEDVISDDIDLVEDYILTEEYIEVRNLILRLPKKEQEIIKLYFGFYGRKYRQEEIADKFNIAQGYVSRIVKRVLIKLKDEIINNKQMIKKP